MTPQCAGHAVLVFESEDATIHQPSKPIVGAAVYGCASIFDRQTLQLVDACGQNGTMSESVALPLVHLTTVVGGFHAEVLRARLVDEGFDVRLRPVIGNPYLLTVGEMAEVGVFVPEDQLQDASYVLLVTAVDDVLDETPEEHARKRYPARWYFRVTAAALLFVAFGPLVQVLWR